MEIVTRPGRWIIQVPADTDSSIECSREFPGSCRDARQRQCCLFWESILLGKPACSSSVDIHPSSLGESPTLLQVQACSHSRRAEHSYCSTPFLLLAWSADVPHLVVVTRRYNGRKHIYTMRTEEVKHRTSDRALRLRNSQRGPQSPSSIASTWQPD